MVAGTEGNMPEDGLEAGDAPTGTGVLMKKALNLVLEEAEVIELIRVLMDDDAEGALTFLRKHFKGKARELLEGG